MKKVLVILAVLFLTVGMVFAATTRTTPSKGTARETKTTTSDSSYVMETSKTTTFVHHGDVEKLSFEGPVLITSFGQSTDTNSLGAVFKTFAAKGYNVDYTCQLSITAEDVKNYKTIIIVPGMSSKGLGAAGISKEDEYARVEKILAETKKQGTAIILAHVGGVERRGVDSDKLTDMVAEQAKYMFVVEKANDDYKFTNLAAAKNIPYTFVLSTAKVADFLPKLFK